MMPIGRSHQAPPIVAVDLGASSGRVLVGVPTDQGLDVSEIHRFANRPVSVEGHTELQGSRPRLARLSDQGTGPIASPGRRAR